MPSEAQKRADRKYKRNKTRQFCLRFYPSEAAMWDYLSAQDNKQGFLKGLISDSMGVPPVSASTASLSAKDRNLAHHGEQQSTLGSSTHSDGVGQYGRVDSQ